jgi:hypothetical protein
MKLALHRTFATYMARSLTLVGAAHSTERLYGTRSLTLARVVAAAGGCRAR